MGTFPRQIGVCIRPSRIEALDATGRAIAQLPMAPSLGTCHALSQLGGRHLAAAAGESGGDHCGDPLQQRLVGPSGW